MDSMVVGVAAVAESESVAFGFMSAVVAFCWLWVRFMAVVRLRVVVFGLVGLVGCMVVSVFGFMVLVGLVSVEFGGRLD